MSATSPRSNDDSDPPPSQHDEADVKPKTVTVRQAGFTRQEILMLAQAYMRESLDPIRGTNKKADVMWKDIYDSYDKLRQAHDRSKMDRLSLDTPFTPLPERTSVSLKNQWSKSLQPSVNKFAGIHFKYAIKSGENEERYFERLFALYKKEVELSKLKIPSKFEKYHQAYLWLRSQPKFGSHFEDPNQKDDNTPSYNNMDEDRDGSSESDPSPVLTPPPRSKIARARPSSGRDKSKKKKKVDELAEKAANNVKEYIDSTTKQQSSHNNKQSAKRWKTIEKVMVDMSTATQQLIQMQVMEEAPTDQRNQFFNMMREKALIDAKLALSLSQQKEHGNNVNSNHDDSNDDDSDADDIFVEQL